MDILKKKIQFHEYNKGKSMLMISVKNIALLCIPSYRIYSKGMRISLSHIWTSPSSLLCDSPTVFGIYIVKYEVLNPMGGRQSEEVLSKST